MSKSKRPSPEAMCVAAEWLRCYEDTVDGKGESIDCFSVADWLEQQIEDQDLRKMAKENGVSMKAVRRVLIREKLL